MQKRNKHWRILQRNKQYAAKMKLFASYGGQFMLNNCLVTNPRWIELYEANWNPVYKSVRTPCSCMMCSGEKYNRREFKLKTRRALNEAF